MTAAVESRYRHLSATKMLSEKLYLVRGGMSGGDLDIGSG